MGKKDGDLAIQVLVYILNCQRRIYTYLFERSETLPPNIKSICMAHCIDPSFNINALRQFNVVLKGGGGYFTMEES